MTVASIVFASLRIYNQEEFLKEYQKINNTKTTENSELSKHFKAVKK